MGKKSREKKEKKEIEEIVLKQEKPETAFTSLCKKIILFSVFLVLFTPLVIDADFLFPFVGPKSIYFMVLVLIIFSTYLLLISVDPKYRPKLNSLLIALILFIAVLTVSLILSANPSYSFWSKYERMTGFLMTLHLLAFFVVISSVFKKKEDWFKIFGVSIFIASLISIIALFMKIDISLIGQIGAISQDGATLGNSSFLGTYLLFNIFLALYLFTQASIASDGSQKKRSFFKLKTTGGFKVFSGISLIIILIALLLSGARAAIFSMFGGLVLLFLFWFIFYKKGILKFVGLALLIILIVGIFFITWLAFQPNSFVNEELIQMGFGARFLVWEGALQGWLERPWFGWGLENFDLAFIKHFNPLLFLPGYGGEIWFDRAHNIIIDTLVTTGLVGFLAYLGIFAAAFYLLWSRYLKEKICFWTAGIFSSLLIAYFVQNLTVFDMVSSFMMFFLVLGFVASITIKENEKLFIYNQKNLNPFITIIVLTFFSFSFFYFIIQPFKAGHYVIEAFGIQPSSPERITLYKKTLATSPLGREQIRLFFADEAINFFHSNDGLLAIQEKSKNSKLKLDFLTQELEKSIKESPLDFRSHLTLGNLYNIYAQINPEKLIRAEQVLKRAIEISPSNPQGYWLLTQVKLHQGDIKTAFSLAEQAVVIEPRINRSHFILVETAKIKRGLDFAKEKAREAMKINPDWEQNLEQLLKSDL